MWQQMYHFEFFGLETCNLYKCYFHKENECPNKKNPMSVQTFLAGFSSRNLLSEKTGNERITDYISEHKSLPGPTHQDSHERCLL